MVTLTGSGSGDSNVFGYPNLQDDILKDLETTYSVLMRIFQPESAERSTVCSNTANPTVTLAIAVVMAGFAVVMIISLHVCLCVCYFR